MESCEAGLQDRLNAKELKKLWKCFDKQGATKCFPNKLHHAWLQSQVTKQRKLWLSLSGLVTVHVLATNISSFYEKCASEYLQRLALC